MAKPNHQVMTLEREVRLLRERIARIYEDPGDSPVVGCGDNSCLVETPNGMATNGGCGCSDHTLRRAVMWLKRRCAFMQATIQQMRAESTTQSQPVEKPSK